MRRGDVVLFTGAGFSMGARDKDGVDLPSSRTFRSELWPIAFPEADEDEDSTLGEVFHAACRRSLTATRQLCQRRMTADPSSLDDTYRSWFSFPWYRMYTVNVDDLEEAALRAFELPRRIRSLSALRGASLPSISEELLCIHINGRMSDFPDVTFSAREYGERTAHPDPWYQHLIDDIVHKPILFVGTQLDEPPLWHHIAMRGEKRGGTELRPGSYLVTPQLSVGRRSLLQDLNIEWLEMSQEDFVHQVLDNLEESRVEGLRNVSARAERPRTVAVTMLDRILLSRGLDLAEYLRGREPRWEDILEGFAVEREFESSLFPDLLSHTPGIAILTGTAGSGKTTTLMRLARQFQARGDVVAWVESDFEGPLRQLRTAVQEARPGIVVVDDLDQYGRSAGGLVSELASDNPTALVLASVRSTRYEDLQLQRHTVDEALQFTVPHLEDSDIELLIGALDRARRLGRLQAMSHEQRVRAFRESAGRQLLVALVEATSGERFDHRLDRECSELGNDLGAVYAVIALATNFRHRLYLDEILGAIGQDTNEGLNKVRNLENQKLIIRDGHRGYQLRHRYVADRAVDYYKTHGQLGEPARGLLFAVASRAGEGGGRRSRLRSLLISLMNHETLARLVHDIAQIRDCYSTVESLLDWDYHFWLQRGCFEVKHTGELRTAQNYLESAKALAPDDALVMTEWSYMMLRRAIHDPSALDAPSWADEAIRELEDAIEQRGLRDSYPYHVYGSQGLSWVRRANMSDDTKIRFLDKLRAVLREGVSRHNQQDLRQLQRDIDAEYLEMSLPAERRRFSGARLEPEGGEERSASSP